MKTIIYQGSGGTIGDIFFSSAPMYHIKKTTGRRIVVALPKDLNSEIRELYDHHTFLDDIHHLEDIREGAFLPHAQQNGFEPHLFLKSVHHLRGMRFYKLSEWFVNPSTPTIGDHNCVSVQLMSTSNWTRPAIPGWRVYLELILKAGLKPLFVGSKTDGEKIIDTYPGIDSYAQGSEYWRFGKDTILETVANLGCCKAALVFSSWTTYGAVLQGVPALELWSREQWLYYTPMTRLMLGNPVHYLQECFESKPSLAVFRQALPRLAALARTLYD